MTRVTQPRRGRAVLALTAGLALMPNPLAGAVSAAPPPQPPKNPNILFFIMDDVGIDQMQIFGYGGLPLEVPPRTPNIDAIARAGVCFRNTWATPECSPSRAMFFEGRYPFRTNVSSAILSLDLANSQVSPFEVTTPRVLKQAGYDSALFGKFHLSGSNVNLNNNPLGDGVVHALGWDHFAGFLDGAPFPIDTTAGGGRSDDRLDYHPEETNTMVVIIGDNGTFFPGVKGPFDPLHSKATPYQTGVWVPLIVAGPLVNAPDREVRHMVNVADLFELFGEIAGVDVHKAVLNSHVLDSASMLPYLTTPNRGSIGKTNFTQIGDNLKGTNIVVPPCVITSVNTCLQVLPQKEACEFEQGVWYGPDGAAGPEGLNSCCAVNEFLQRQDPPQPKVTILPKSQLAIRNDQFKLVQIEQPNCDTGQVDTTTEFYEINELAPLPRIDRPVGQFANNLLTSQPNLTPIQKQNFNSLSAQLQKLLDSQPPPCPGDGNLDRMVNAEDLDNWQFFNTENGGHSSWYDFNLDGLTNNADGAIIEQNLGTKCPK